MQPPNPESPRPEPGSEAHRPSGTSGEASTGSASQVEALKSSSIIGGSTAIVMLIRMIRTKVVAVLLGPVGVGLESIFDSILNVTKTLFDLGINSSGVRQIAASVGTGDARAIAVSARTLRRVCVVLGVAGSLSLFFAREPVSRLAFGTAEHGHQVGVLAAAIFLSITSSGLGALLQGMRRIRDLAMSNILGTVGGVLTTIPIVYFWGRDGIAHYMVLGSAVALGISWYYSRRVTLEHVQLPFGKVLSEASGMLKLGFAFVLSTLISTGTLFLLRILVTRMQGVEGAGQFQAASALSMVYVGFVLQSMGTDFYPRLTAVAHDNAKCNQVVNDQAEVSLLLALPGIVCTLALSPWVIHLFYSDRFKEAAAILGWQTAGMFVRVASWPMGFILVAKGRGTAFVLTDAAAFGVYLLLAWAGLQFFGLPGAGMAFLGLYLFHWCLILVVVRRLSGFAWSSVNVRRMAAGSIVVATALVCRLLLPEPASTLTGLGLGIACGWYCLRRIMRIAGGDRVKRLLRRFRIPLPIPTETPRGTSNS